MRALLILVFAVAGFAGYFLWNQRAARELVRNEEVALGRLRELAPAGAGDAREEAGYRFAWVAGEELPGVWVAAPLVRGEAGVRWFVTTDGASVYQFDTVLFRAPQNRPDVRALRRHLAMPGDERREQAPPAGWQTTE